MRAIVLFLQLVFWLVVARLVIRAVARLLVGSRRAQPAAPPAAAPRGIEDLVLCRTCRTHVPRSNALTARVSASEERFCSEACRDRALAEVARAS